MSWQMTCILKFHLSNDKHFEIDYVKWQIEGLGHLSFDGLGEASRGDMLSNGLWHVQISTLYMGLYSINT